MSKIKSDKIEYENSNFIVQVNTNFSSKISNDELQQESLSEDDLMKNRIENMLNEAQIKANEIIENAQNEANKLISDAENKSVEIINEAEKNAQDKEKEIIENSQKEIEEKRIEQAKIGYEEGHNDGITKSQEELEEKIISFDKFIEVQSEIKNKILKSSKKDILEIIINIARKILKKEINSEALKKIIDSTIALLERKENVNIILSEKYAKLLFEVQNQDLEEKNEFNFEDFKQYDNFNVSFNPKIQEDTIIVENPKEHFDASINNQLDVIIKDIYENVEKDNLEFDLEEKEDEIK